MFQPLWMFVDQQEETQLDFFDLCEDPAPETEPSLGSQSSTTGEYNDET